MSTTVSAFLTVVIFLIIYVYVRNAFRKKFVNKETGVVYILKKVLQTPYGDTFVLQSTKDAKIINVLREDLGCYFKSK